MMVRGILETALHVADPARSGEFYRRHFGFETLLESERLVALNVANRDVLLLFKQGGTDEPLITPGGTIPPHGGAGRLHLAFAIEAVEEASWMERLACAGIAVESVVAWPGGGRSLYFRDLDGHLVELATPGLWAIY